MPLGHVLSHVFEDPQSLGSEDLGIQVTLETLESLRCHLEGEEGSSAYHLDFVSPDFSEKAAAAAAELELPQVTWFNSWEIFDMIAARLEVY